MAIKGMSDEVVSAMNFDPFEATGRQAGGSGEPPAQQSQQPRDPQSGRFTPTAEPGRTGEGPGTAPRAPRVPVPTGRNVSPAGALPSQTREAQGVPAGMPATPGEQGV